MLATVLAYTLFAILMVYIGVVDARTLRIPNGLLAVLTALWALWRVALGVLAAATGGDFLIGLVEGAPFTGVTLSNGVVGAVALGGVLLVAMTIYEALTKRPGVGAGDIKLLAVVGLYLGLEGGLMCLAVACVIILLAMVIPPPLWESLTSGRRANAENVAAEDAAGAAEPGASEPGAPELSAAESAATVAEIAAASRLHRSLPMAPAIAAGAWVSLSILAMLSAL